MRGQKVTEAEGRSMKVLLLSLPLPVEQLELQLNIPRSEIHLIHAVSQQHYPSVRVCFSTDEI